MLRKCYIQGKKIFLSSLHGKNLIITINCTKKLRGLRMKILKKAAKNCGL